MPKGHMAGKRISGTHTTFTRCAAEVRDFLLNHDYVSSISAGRMRSARSARYPRPKLIIKILSPRVLELKVVGGHKMQILTIMTDDLEHTVYVLRRQFRTVIRRRAP